MDGDQVSTRERRGPYGAADLMRDVVHLQVEEDLEPALLEGSHDGRPLGVEERHADLHPLGATFELLAQGERLLAAAIQRHDHAVSGFGL